MGVQHGGQFVHPDGAVKADGGFGSGVQVRPQQRALTRGTLPEQPPLDGPGRLAQRDRQRRVFGAAGIAEAQDALDTTAERIADRKRAAGASLRTLGEVLGTVYPDELPLRQCETDAVGAGDPFGEHESGDALERRETSGQRRLSETAQEDRPVRIGDGDVHLAAGEHGLQLVEHGDGRADDPAVPVEIFPEGKVGLVRREAEERLRRHELKIDVRTSASTGSP